MLRAQLKTMLEITERKVEELTLRLQKEEQSINNDIQATHKLGARLGEHYWQEAHTTRQEIASARFLIGIIRDTLAEDDRHASG